MPLKASPLLLPPKGSLHWSDNVLCLSFQPIWRSSSEYVAGPTELALIATSLNSCPPPVPGRCSSSKDLVFFCFTASSPLQPQLGQGFPGSTASSKAPKKDLRADSGRRVLMLTHCLQQQHLRELPRVGAVQQLLVFHGNLSADGRAQLPQALQSLTWKSYEFLKLLLQPADFFTQLNVIHPAETQTKPLRERPGEERFQTSSANTQPTVEGKALSAHSGERRFTCLPPRNSCTLHLRAFVGATWVVPVVVGKVSSL